MKLSVFLLTLTLPFSGALAQDGPYLDPDYPEKNVPYVYSRADLMEIEAADEPFEKVSHLMTALAQTPVKSQGGRGTCSIFSSTAILEYSLKQVGMTSEDLDLSEQWLEYITSGQRGSEGSWSYYNFDKYGRYGYLDESMWSYRSASWFPYSEDYWEVEATALEKEIFAQSCEGLKDTALFDGCLVGQMDPRLLGQNEQTLMEKNMQFLEWRNSAINSISNKLKISSQFVSSNADIQDNLDHGDVLAMDITFFYEAWNHGRGTSMGLQKDAQLWDDGIVSYPHPNSLDALKSRDSDVRAGHSIVIIGYDHDVVITREVEDRDGNMMTVTTKGVYYFKNSWGQNGFGVNFEFKGEKLPGFGMISMDYAHEHGSFYKMKVQKITQ